MKGLLKLGLVMAALIAIGVSAYRPALDYWKRRHAPQWRTMETDRGDILSVVNSTGKVQPVLSVHVGSFVSGPIDELYVDFNDEVQEGQILAEIETRIYDAAVDRDKATLATRRAEVQRVEALLQQAINDEQRSQRLRERNENYISDTEMDQYKFNRMSLEAQLVVAEASVDQAMANLRNSEANLSYTKITSPVSGIIIDRKIDPGQTLAAQFQTPELFVVAPNIREKIHIFASIDEADIGLIRQAQQRQRAVKFTVDAYPDELFEGQVEQIRLSSTQTQNVVTYPVVVAAPNSDLKLLPGMTASMSFEIDEQKDVLRIPNAALRFYPESKYVREEDRKVLEGAQREPSEDDSERLISAKDKADANRNRNRRHVWIQEGEFLRAVEVMTGISDYKFTEVVSGSLKSGQKLVVGIEPKKGK